MSRGCQRSLVPYGKESRSRGRRRSARYTDPNRPESQPPGQNADERRLMPSNAADCV